MLFIHDKNRRFVHSFGVPREYLFSSESRSKLLLASDRLIIVVVLV